MTENQYKELNAYLNELFIYLEGKFEPMINNILPIFILNDKYKELIEKYNLDVQYKENGLTYNDVYLLAKEIIEQINPKYLNDYNNLIRTGELDFSYEDEYYDSNFTHTKNHNLININRSFNYSDVETLIHEYFHYINGKETTSYNRFLLTEFLSIYFELYAIDYLINNDIPLDEINYSKRIMSTYKRVKNIYYVEIPIITYSKFGSIDETSYKMLCEFYAGNLTKEQFDYECETLLNWFKDVEKEYKISNFKCDYDEFDLRKHYSGMFENYFLYFIGTVFAFYAKENCNIKDIVYINDHINDQGLSVFDCLEKMKTDTEDDDFDNKVIKSIEKYLTKFNVKSR